eukprot:CAMPEP_0168551702 /NCGR_PEP_ID=MMETSP0413-20121227/6319_1 /TAXON_ID=136452 /ORGANISM="Filamoeba nolandi, Strain NC-AS-23-1" /LENGTH=316 /DNA_ID=CAMNT_0008582257 /DNA_START=44 /DNA_END=994 /DNA_ORIENTATION=-
MAAQIEEAKSVLVTNISPSANEKTVSDFFSFCGKINKLYLKKDEGSETRTAVVQFETESAGKTALLLTNALIVDRPINVAPYISQATVQSSPEPVVAQQQVEKQQATVDPNAQVDEAQISQRNFGGVPDEQRTKTSVVASMLAAGYVLANDSLEKAKDYDEKHNISLYAKVAVEQLKVKAHEIDQQYKISEKAEALKNTAVEKAKTIDSTYHVSEKAKEVALGVQQTAVTTAAKLNENPTVHSAVESAKQTASYVTAMFNDYKEQTQKAIEEKQRAKQAEQGHNPAQQPPQPAQQPAEQPAQPAAPQPAEQPAPQQ